MPNSDEVLSANQALRGEIAEFKKNLDGVIHREKQTRWFLTAVAGVVLIIIFVWIANKLEAQNDKIEGNQQYREEACIVANSDRAAQSQALVGVLEESKKGKTPEVVAVLDSQIAKLKKAYSQRDCKAARDNRVVLLTPSPTP